MVKKTRHAPTTLSWAADADAIEEEQGWNNSPSSVSLNPNPLSTLHSQFFQPPDPNAPPSFKAIVNASK